MTTESPQLNELNDQIIPIKISLQRMLNEFFLNNSLHQLMTTKDCDYIIRQIQNIDKLLISVTRQPNEKKFSIKLSAAGDETKNEKDIFILLSKEMATELFQELADNEYRILCLLGAQSVFDYYDWCVRCAKSGHLNSRYNSDYTHKQFYAIERCKAKDLIELMDELKDSELKDAIPPYFIDQQPEEQTS